VANATGPSTARTSVKIIEAAPGSARLRGRQLIVVRGTLVPAEFDIIVAPPYQRQLMVSTGKQDELVEALSPTDGIGIPDDLLLCCRTTAYRAIGAGEILIDTDALYILDGLQRYGAAMVRRRQGWPTEPFGVKILLGTDEELEERLFYQVNRLQTKVATDVHLRNAASNAACVALRKMSENTPGFPDVKWDQARGSGEKITAHMLYEIAIMLHGYAQNRPFEGILEALEELTDRIGTDRLVTNVRHFFDYVHRCFDGTDMEPYRWRVDMLRGLARYFSEYENFWSGENLMVRKPDVEKLRGTKWDEIIEALRQSNASAAVTRAFIRQKQRRRGAELQPRVQNR